METLHEAFSRTNSKGDLERRVTFSKLIPLTSRIRAILRTYRLGFAKIKEGNIDAGVYLLELAKLGKDIFFSTHGRLSDCARELGLSFSTRSEWVNFLCGVEDLFAWRRGAAGGNRGGGRPRLTKRKKQDDLKQKRQLIALCKGIRKAEKNTEDTPQYLGKAKALARKYKMPVKDVLDHAMHRMKTGDKPFIKKMLRKHPSTPPQRIARR